MVADMILFDTCWLEINIIAFCLLLFLCKEESARNRDHRIHIDSAWVGLNTDMILLYKDLQAVDNI
jgi:hypothetical protein